MQLRGESNLATFAEIAPRTSNSALQLLPGKEEGRQRIVQRGMHRSWWEDETTNAQLNERVAAGWFVVNKKSPEPVPGKVVKICYAGLKVAWEDKTLSIILPDNAVDLTAEEFEEAARNFHERAARLAAEQKAAREAEEARPKRKCDHPSSTTEETARAAGCDIYDTTCTVCGQLLRTSWSTAYDKDPDDLITDWDWWVAEYRRLYNQTPNRADYKVQEKCTYIYL